MLSACTAAQEQRNREALFAEIQPVALSNCTLERFGDKGDGGYLMCGNLLAAGAGGYSYGINGNDEWGCAVAGRLGTPMHQYDCFNTDRPACVTATTVFHEECIGPKRETTEGRLFDTLEAQIARNGDAGKNLVVKMDVESAEWPSFEATPDAVLEKIDQLTVEFHDVHKAQFVEVMRKLKRSFHVVHVHFNNWVCDPKAAPFPSLAFEVLFVNKRIAVVDTSRPGSLAPHPLDSPNNAKMPDCQVTESKSPR